MTPNDARSEGPAGSTVFREENHDLPVARLSVTLRLGAAADPADQMGLTAFAAELARRGAGGRGRTQLDAELERLGAELEVVPGYDSVVLDLEVLARNFEPAVRLLADVLLLPDLDEGEATKLQRETIAALDELRDDDSALAQRFFSHQLYGDHPYGRPLHGTEPSLTRLSAPLARRTLERTIAGGNLIFGLAGDVERDRFEAILARRFGSLRSGSTATEPLPTLRPASKLRLLLVDKPERTQSQILLGQPAPRWADPDFLPLQVAATAFGGTFTARLMTEVRVKRGLSYGATARLGQGRGARALAVTVFPSLVDTPKTLALVLELWRAWVEEGLTEDEVEFAKNHMAGSFGFHIATPEDRLDLAVAAEVCGLPRDYRERAVARIRAVTCEEVRGAMERHLRPQDLAITVVSTAKKLRGPLSKVFSGPIEVVPYGSF